MGKLKDLWWRLRYGGAPEAKRHNRCEGIDPKGQAGKILAALLRGEVVGGHEAVKITRSHNGLRRLNEVRKRLRQAGIPYVSRAFRAGAKKTWLHPRQYDAARKLFRA